MPDKPINVRSILENSDVNIVIMMCAKEDRRIIPQGSYWMADLPYTAVVSMITPELISALLLKALDTAVLSLQSEPTDAIGPLTAG
jgi:hypothetical protein